MATWEYEVKEPGNKPDTYKGMKVFKDNSMVLEMGNPNWFGNSEYEMTLIAITKLSKQGLSDSDTWGMTRRPSPPPSPPDATSEDPGDDTDYVGEEEEEEQKAPPPNLYNPTDPRLLFAIDSASGEVVYSMSAEAEFPLIDGMVFSKDGSPSGTRVTGKDLDDDQANKFEEFFGVPGLINSNAYINIQSAGGKLNNKYLIDRENSKRFYNVNEPAYEDGSGAQASSAPTTTEIVKWSQADANVYKFPYKFTDFAFCKWWKKIPNNYMVTLRRYAFPVNDGVLLGEKDAKSQLKKDNLKPVATMVTYLGESTGNKISSILGPIETGVKWKDLTAEVWEVNTSGSAAEVNNPAPGLAKALGFLTNGGEGTKTKTPGPVPPDPYNNGPYANKIIGPVNVIESTKIRERGLEFKHSISLVFEYSLRGIGGISTKAAGLDIIGNSMLMTSATAPFWGGANRHMPNAGFGTADPFLGGEDGKAAWIQGDPEKFFSALGKQFSQIADNMSDLFNKVLGAGVEGGLQMLAEGGLKEFMKASTTKAKMTVTGVHSLLTGAPVGEWHITVGPPMNPMMMIGNMICTTGKLEFSDELGPDDFPTEIKMTIQLEHGMPRDKAGIESMFNKGRGRIYSLPKGYENSFASSAMSPVDTAIPPKHTYLVNTPTKEDNKTADEQASKNDKEQVISKKPVVANVFGALYSQGYGSNPSAK
jgi:hypothetical protein